MQSWFMALLIHYSYSKKNPTPLAAPLNPAVLLLEKSLITFL